MQVSVGWMVIGEAHVGNTHSQGHIHRATVRIADIDYKLGA